MWFEIESLTWLMDEKINWFEEEMIAMDDINVLFEYLLWH